MFLQDSDANEVARARHDRGLDDAGKPNRIIPDMGKPPMAGLEAWRRRVLKERLLVKVSQRVSNQIVGAVNLTDAVGHVTFIPGNHAPQSRH